MKILYDNSILNFLPLGIKEEQLLIFDSLRITLEIIQHNYNCLEKNLDELSDADKKKENVSITFSYAWGIIDNISRFIKLYHKLPSESNYQILDGIKHINAFRNTIQHLYERIGESLLKNKSPFYGVLTWFHKDAQTQETIPHNLFSGLYLSGMGVTFTVPDLSLSNTNINDILIQTVDKNKIIQTNLTELVNELKKVCGAMEEKLESVCNDNNLQKCDWTARKDILIRMKS